MILNIHKLLAGRNSRFV